MQSLTMPKTVAVELSKEEVMNETGALMEKHVDGYEHVRIPNEIREGEEVRYFIPAISQRDQKTRVYLPRTGGVCVKNGDEPYMVLKNGRGIKWSAQKHITLLDGQKIKKVYPTVFYRKKQVKSEEVKALEERVAELERVLMAKTVKRK